MVLDRLLVRSRCGSAAQCVAALAVLGCLAASSLERLGATPSGAYVADSSRDRVLRLLNLDRIDSEEPAAGQWLVFYDDSSDGPDLSVPAAIAVDERGRVLLLDGGTLDAVFLLEDRNGDGDANDPDEFQVFFESQGSAACPALATPNDLVRASDGALFLSDNGRSRGLLLGLADRNGDDDALDEGECWTVYDSRQVAADSDHPILADPRALAVGAGGVLFVLDGSPPRVFMLDDRNGDGDALDAGEATVIYQPVESLALVAPSALRIGVSGELFLAGEESGVVLRLEDRDLDGRIQGEAEVAVVADRDAAFELRDLNDLQVDASGALYVLDGDRDQVFRLRDEDGDGAARSEGEIQPVVVAGGLFGTPAALALESRAAGFVRGDFDGDGTLALVDAELILAFLFLGVAAPPCLDVADVDDDGFLDVSDAIVLLWHLFAGGGPLPAPFPEPGDDPTPDALGCATAPPANGEAR